LEAEKKTRRGGGSRTGDGRPEKRYEPDMSGLKKGPSGRGKWAYTDLGKEEKRGEVSKRH